MGNTTWLGRAFDAVYDSRSFLHLVLGGGTVDLSVLRWQLHFDNNSGLLHSQEIKIELRLHVDNREPEIHRYTTISVVSRKNYRKHNQVRTLQADLITYLALTCLNSGRLAPSCSGVVPRFEDGRIAELVVQAQRLTEV